MSESSEQAVGMQPKPTGQSERIELVDVLRGFAVFGILVANMASFSGMFSNPGAGGRPLDQTIVTLIHFFVQAKFYSLFSFLFGWGFALQMRRAEQRGSAFLPLYIRRLLALLLFGVIHGTLIWTGDILTFYALLGFLLLLFRRRSIRFLLAASAIALVLAIVLTLPWEAVASFREAFQDFVSPVVLNRYSQTLYTDGTFLDITRLRIQDFLAGTAYSFYAFGNVFAMFLLGLAAGKARLFTQLKDHLPRLRRALIPVLLSGVLFNTLFVLSNRQPDLFPDAYQNTIRVGARTIGAPLLMIGYVMTITLLFQKQNWRRKLKQLAPVGRTALSNYIFQSIVCTLIFYDYGLGFYGQLGPAGGLLLTLAIYAVQIRLSAWWLERFLYGPLEWLWRTLTYGVPPVLNRRYPFESALRQPVADPAARSRWALVSAAACLVIWGGCLAVWGRSIQGVSLNAQSLFHAIQSIAPEPGSGPNPQRAEAEESQARPGLLEQAVAVQRTPGNLAATGKLGALAETFDASSAQIEIEALAGRRFAGRQAGSPGGEAAGDYLASRFEALGLLPAGEQGTYFQSFEVPYSSPSGMPRLEVWPQGSAVRGDFRLLQDFAIVAGGYAGPGEVQAAVTWVDDCQPEDFRRTDVVDKVVFCLHEPGVDADRNAIEYGAAGLLLLNENPDRPLDFAYPRFEPLVPEPIPVVLVGPRVSTALLAGSGISLQDLKLSSAPRELESEVHLQIDLEGREACVNETCLGRNVLGWLPGSDPRFSDQVIVLSAHYDHMGASPDGTYWPGANDDASGVAVLLEIARSWQEQGYVPKRSVLFAAWDAEELGLIGSKAYVADPTLPRDSILAVIQLDMVGAGGPLLAVGGEQRLAALVERSAAAYGVESVVGDFGGSDHISFLERGLDAVLLIWYGEDGLAAGYHRPSDTAGSIDLERLQQVGLVTHLTLLSLADGEPTIQSVLDRRATALLAGDMQAFLETSDPEQLVQNQSWYQAATANDLSSAEFVLSNLALDGDEARGDVKMTLAYSPEEGSDDTQRGIYDLPVRFRRVNGSWRWSGPGFVDLTPLAPAGSGQPLVSSLDVRVHASQAEALSGLEALEPSLEWLSRFGRQLDLTIPSGLTIEIFPNTVKLCAFSDPGPECRRSLWIGSQTLRVTDDYFGGDFDRLENALAQWLLYRYGLREQIAPWIWNGLPAAFQIDEDPEQGAGYFSPLYNVLIQEGRSDEDVEAWAAADYLKDRLGWAGVGRLVRVLGSGCAATDCTLESERVRVLSEGLRMAPEQFETAWREAWTLRFEGVMRELRRTLERRAEALLQAEPAEFLSTVDPAIPGLLAEQEAYYQRLLDLGAVDIQWGADPVLLYPDGSVLALVRFSGMTVDGEAISDLPRGGSYISFTPSGSGLRWSGYPLQEMRHGHTVILYPAGFDAVAGKIAGFAEQVQDQISSRLGLLPSRQLVLKLYNVRSALSNTIPMLAVDESLELWVTPGASIKILVSEPDPEGEDIFQASLVEAILRSTLSEAGLDQEWLVRGASLYLAPNLDHRERKFAATRNLRSLASAASNEELPLLSEIPGDEQIADENLRDLADAQSWDAVRTLVEMYGSKVLNEILQQIASGATAEQAFEQATGVTPSQFESIWLESYFAAHIEPDWPVLVGGFDPEQAMDFLSDLTQPSYSGRGSGTSGAEAAAEYIQARFQEFGLLPVVAPVPISPSDPEAQEVLEKEVGSTESAAELSYFQSFQIYRVLYERAPGLSMTFTDTGAQQSFLYREEFIDLPQSYEYDGPVRGDLVWLDNERSYPQVDLAGKVVMKIESEDPAADALQAAERGASGLILVSRRNLVNSFFAKSPRPVSPPETVGIPVFRINQGLYQELLRAAGRNEPDLKDGPAVAQLPIVAELDLPLLPAEEVQAVNVLGLLPGSDPELSDEIIILGAHYDHVGDDPDTWGCSPGTTPDEEAILAGMCEVSPGTRYPGANDDASGIAALLEIARIWHAAGYRPARSVLFAAWGAQEPGQYGSEYYSDHPVFPLEDTGAMIQLDSVGGGRGFYLEVHGTLEHDGLLTASAGLLEEFAQVRLSLVRKSIDSSSFQPAIPAQWLTWPDAMDEETSDQLPFREQGVPSALLTWRGASEANLPADLADEVQPERLAMAGRLAALLAMTLTR
ncbi:MAG: M20/M25/M40 family metallo-hydrolase [Anaerolineales bacterium]